MSDHRIAIVGTGNILHRDEGVGVHVIKELKDRALPDHVTLMDAGTATLDAFIDVDHAEKVVIVDAVKGGGNPGDIYRFPLDHIVQNQRYQATSLHQISLYESLQMARLTMEQVPEVIVIGVEPERIDPGMELSPKVKSRLKDVVSIVIQESLGSKRIVKNSLKEV